MTFRPWLACSISQQLGFDGGRDLRVRWVSGGLFHQLPSLGEVLQGAGLLPLAQGGLEGLAEGFVLLAFGEGDRQWLGGEEWANLAKGGMFLEPAC